MSSFVNRLQERKEKDRLSHVDYAGFRRMGALRPVTMRLPVTTVAKMKLLEELGATAWESRQEMLFEMIESCIQDWIDQQPNSKILRERFDAAARRGLQTKDDDSNLGPSDPREL
jgi:hypothetical protein